MIEEMSYGLEESFPRELVFKGLIKFKCLSFFSHDIIRIIYVHQFLLLCY